MNKTLDIVTTMVAVLLLGALVALSVRGIVDPASAALAFGVPAVDSSAQFYHAVYRDRNLVLAVTGFVFLLSSMWRALAILATTAISLPAYDIAVLTLAQVPVAGVHAVTLAGLVVLSILLWLRVRRDAASRLAR
ncbi:MAG: DUF4267 domain-containing protein [Cytophagales bacterium]|nr:DUF4267 domain-containing protein [Rhizobacter sp.]